MKNLIQFFVMFIFISNAYSQTSPQLKINGDKQLKLSMLKVTADISNQYAKVTYDMTFYNGKNRILEGELAFPLGQGQTVSHLSMDLNGILRDAVVVEKELGRVAYENTIKQRIDPVLLEKTKGNNYKVRVYPIPAKGYKRIVISYEQNLSVLDNNYLFEIPFDFKNRLDDFELEIIQNSKEIMPIVDGLFQNNLKFKRNSKNVIAQFKAKDFSANNSLKIKFPTNSNVSLIVEDDHFFLNKNIQAKSRLKENPESIVLLWDASYSMQYKNLEKELELLDLYFSEFENVKVELIAFSNSVLQVEKMIIKDGNWSYLRNKLENVDYDGGTSYQKLPISNVDEVILVSDGMHNLGNLNPKNFKRFYAINSVKSANHELLEAYSNKFGGNYINLNRDTVILSLEKLRNESLQFLGIKSNNRIFEVYPKNNEVVNGNFSLGGKHFNANKVELLFGYKDEVVKTIKIDMQTGVKSNLAKRLWAKQKLKYLEKSAKENKEKIIGHSKDNHLISQYTSMIVLDRISDYVRYKIEPPIELMDDYKRLLSNSKRQEVSRAKIIERRLESLKEDYEDLIEWYTKDFNLKPKIKVKPEIKPTISNVPTSTNLVNQSTASVSREFDSLQPTISGIITASSDGLPLPGVNVYIKGSTRGTQTDFDGKYTINAERGETLVFSFVSMQTEEIVLNNQQNVDLVMKDNTSSLDEVVITGYATTTRAKSSVSSVRISSEQIENRPNASFVQTLSGQVPGLNITTASGNPGGNSIVQIRGVSSINGNTNPLFVVDGVLISENEFRNLNPKDIAEVSVLKDAGATAIYGNRGANGVIVIKTMEGLENRSELIKELDSKIEEHTTLQSWKKNASYLALLNEQVDIDKAYKLYLELREKYHNTPSFFLDVAEFFESRNNYRYALRVVSNLIEIEIDNHELIRALAYKLEQYKEYDLVVHVYEEVLNLRPEEPQSVRDLALAYIEIGEDEKAYKLLNKIVEGDLLEKDEASNYYGIEQIAYIELSNLVSNSKKLKKYKKDFIDVEVDIRVVIDWNHANTDLDLHIKNPAGEDLYYGKTTSRFGGIISDDMTEGYGPETFKIKNAQKGNYKISVKYFSSSVQKIIGPTSLKVTVFRNFGKSNQTKEIKVLRLTDEEGIIKADTLVI